MSCPTSCTPLKRVLDDRVIPIDGRIPCLGKTLKGQYCSAPISRDRQREALCLLECCIYCSRPDGLPLKHAIKDLALLLVHQQHSGEQDVVYAKWMDMVKSFKYKREKPVRKHHREEHRQKLDRPQEHHSDIIDEPSAPECNEPNQASNLSYKAPTECQQRRIVEGDELAKLTVLHPTLPNPKRPTGSRKSVSVQTEADEVYTPITLRSYFFGLILQCRMMMCGLFKIQFDPTHFCDRAGNMKKASMVRLKLELGIRWSLTDLTLRWMFFTVVSFLSLSILLGPWLGLLCVCWIGVRLQESPIGMDFDAYRI
ncbi:unnamed protein product [Penicillium nalgiovense]|nr:unnamed protein product [Penicillium nalgiovense]